LSRLTNISDELIELLICSSYLFDVVPLLRLMIKANLFSIPIKTSEVSSFLSQENKREEQP